jgi:IS30 family transposase
MAKGKIDYHQLQGWLDEGLSQARIARRFGVNPSSVHKAIKRRNLEYAKVANVKAVPAIVENKINILQQIKSINETMHNELEWVKKTIKTEAAEKERIKLQDQMIKFVAEIRKQMSTLLDVSKTLYNAKEVQAFQQIVMNAIGEADPGTKKKIISKLQEERSVRRAIKGTESLE